MIPNERLAAGILRNDTLGSDRDRARRLGLAAARRRRRARARRARGERRRASARGHARGRAHQGRRRPGAAAAEAGRARPSCAPSACKRLRAGGLLGQGIRARRRIRQGYTRWFALLWTRARQMSRSQRNRRRRRGRGRPRNKALLAMMVVLVLVALGRPLRGRLRDLDRRLRAAARLAEAARARLAVRGPRRRRHAPRLHPVQRAAPPVLGQPDPEVRSRTRRSRSRTSASTTTRASTTRASCAPRSRTSRATRPSRAARRSRCSWSATSTSRRSGPTSARSARPSSPRSSRTSTRKALDPRQVPQHRALRHARRPDRGRRPGGLARLLRQAGREAHAAARSALLAGLPQAPTLLLAGARAREGRGAPQRGAGARWPSSG